MSKRSRTQWASPDPPTNTPNFRLDDLPNEVVFETVSSHLPCRDYLRFCGLTKRNRKTCNDRWERAVDERKQPGSVFSDEFYTNAIRLIKDVKPQSECESEHCERFMTACQAGDRILNLLRDYGNDHLMKEDVKQLVDILPLELLHRDFTVQAATAAPAVLHLLPDRLWVAFNMFVPPANNGTLESQFRRFRRKLGYNPDSEPNESKTFMLDVVSGNGMALKYASEALKYDREIVTNAVKNNGMALEFAAERYRSDKRIAEDAINNNADAFKHADISLRGNIKFATKAVQKNGNVYRWATLNAKENPDLAKAAVSQDPKALRHVNLNYFEPSEAKLIVLTSVEKDGLALASAGEYNDDEGVVLKAVGQNGLALAHASRSLRSRRNVIAAAVANNQDADDFAIEETAVRRPGTARWVMSTQGSPM